MNTLANDRLILRHLRTALDNVSVPAEAAAATATFQRQLSTYLKLTSNQLRALGQGRISQFHEITLNHENTQICISPINKAIKTTATSTKQRASEALGSNTDYPIPQLPYATC